MLGTQQYFGDVLILSSSVCLSISLNLNLFSSQTSPSINLDISTENDSI